MAVILESDGVTGHFAGHFLWHHLYLGMQG